MDLGQELAICWPVPAEPNGFGAILLSARPPATLAASASGELADFRYQQPRGFLDGRASRIPKALASYRPNHHWNSALSLSWLNVDTRSFIHTIITV